MTTPDPQQDAAIAAAIQLEKSVTGLRDEISRVHLYGQRNRHLIWGLAVSLALDVVLSIVVGVVAIQASQASDRAAAANSLANQNKQTQIATCVAGNDSRVANLRLWTFIIDVAAASNPHPTPAQREQLSQIRTYIDGVFAPRDCTTLAPASVPPPPSISIPPPSIPVSPSTR